MNGFFFKFQSSQRSNMAASGEITVAQGGHGNVKIHPYLLTLVRWCVSCLWSTATVLLHSLMRSSLQPITGPRPPSSKPRVLKRAAGTEHLHPEPTVECQLLHQPEHHELDVIFVHGLYGSLGNTWRQGDWRSKYKMDPKKVTIRNHAESNCDCRKSSYKQPNNNVDNENKCNSNEYTYNITDLNDSEMTFKKINEKLFRKIIPKENDLITEQFYNNMLLDQVEIIDNYETQAKFVRDLFRRENNCDNDCDVKDNEQKCNYNENKCNYNENKCNYNDNKCNFNEINEVNECKCTEKKCEVGCGCVCDVCYSHCWPKDWIKMDFPGARVISINYTSDPYLWRPLWIKENKRLSLHVRAEQMMHQLLELRVGDRPIVWVGHSKGGLFIKEIYCKAYEAYQKLNKNEETINTEPKNGIDPIQRSNSTNNDAVIAETIDNIVGNMFDNKQMYKEHDNMTFNDYKESAIQSESNSVLFNEINETNSERCKDNVEIHVSMNELTYNVIRNDNENKCNITDVNENKCNISDSNENKCNKMDSNTGELSENGELSSTIEEASLSAVAALYRRSRGFMFYSVPHRGSPLADIKTPVTARSLELLEISKDCPLVLSLQERWLAASGGRGRSPAVRGFVETCRTLMSVLWLRIVSVDSADAGIGTLLGVSVDHREICKPSSRQCMLYTELTDLIEEALQCKC